MFKKQREMKPSEYASRAIAGLSQGLQGHAIPATAGMGMLFLTPYLRSKAFKSTGISGRLKARTPDEIGNLAERLVRAGGRDPDAFKRKVIFQPMGEKGYADVVQEWSRKGGRPRDILRFGPNVAPESIAHEVGHITGKSPWARALRTVSGFGRTAPALAIPSLVALSGALSSDQENVPTYAKAAPYVGGAQLATILGEEARANLRGAKLLERIGHKMPLAQKLKMFLPTLTYLGHAGLLVGAPLGILKGLELYNRAKQKEQAFEPGKMVRYTPEELADVPLPGEAKAKWRKRLEGAK